MAQTTRDPKATYGTVDVNTVNTLKSSMVSGNVMYASDVNTLINLYNTMNSHYHRYDDAYQLATYGAGYGNWPGAGDRNNYYEDKDTSYPVGATAIATVANTTTATASKHNEIAGQSRTMKTHYHTINDRTAA
jgi:hypothetical protein